MPVLLHQEKSLEAAGMSLFRMMDAALGLPSNSMRIIAPQSHMETFRLYLLKGHGVQLNGGTVPFAHIRHDQVGIDHMLWHIRHVLQNLIGALIGDPQLFVADKGPWHSTHVYPCARNACSGHMDLFTTKAHWVSWAKITAYEGRRLYVFFGAGALADAREHALPLTKVHSPRSMIY